MFLALGMEERGLWARDVDGLEAVIGEELDSPLEPLERGAALRTP